MINQNKRNLCKLDQKFVDQLPLITAGHAKIYFDATLKGFGVCVGRTVKTYVLQREINHKSVRATIGRTTELSVARAREEARKLLHDMRGGHNPNLVKKQAAISTNELSCTLQILLNQHLQSLRLRGCEASVDRYPKSLGLHVNDWLSLPVEFVTREKVIERHKQIGITAGKRTANAVFRVLRALYNLHRIDNPDFHNPIEILSLKKLWFPEKSRDVRIKPHEMRCWMQGVMKQIRSLVQRDYILFTLLNGLRKNEAMSLAWSQIDFMGRSFRIEKTKNKKPLELPMTDLTEAILKGLWNKRDISNKLTSQWVFPSELSSTGHINSVSKALLAVNKAVGLNVRLHDLRRTFVSIANNTKIPYYTIKKLVNHSSSGDVTASVYNIMDIEDLRKPMQQITDEFKKLMEVEYFADEKVVTLHLVSAHGSDLFNASLPI